MDKSELVEALQDIRREMYVVGQAGTGIHLEDLIARLKDGESDESKVAAGLLDWLRKAFRAGYYAHLEIDKRLYPKAEPEEKASWR